MWISMREKQFGQDILVLPSFIFKCCQVYICLCCFLFLPCAIKQAERISISKMFVQFTPFSTNDDALGNCAFSRRRVCSRSCGQSQTWPSAHGCDMLDQIWHITKACDSKTSPRLRRKLGHQPANNKCNHHKMQSLQSEQRTYMKTCHVDEQSVRQSNTRHRSSTKTWFTLTSTINLLYSRA